MKNKSAAGVTLENLLDDIMFHCQTDAGTQEIFGIFERYGVTLKNMKEANKILRLIIDLSNHTKKWVLKGYAPAMLCKPPTTAFEEISPGIGRNDPCPCGSGKKYKKCCGSLLQ